MVIKEKCLNKFHGLVARESYVSKYHDGAPMPFVEKYSLYS